MSETRDDGGHQNGMSLRDYFAIHCDQPGVTELLALAGKTPASNRSEAMVFANWWPSLSNDERFGWYAKCRYAMADAMITERNKTPTPEKGTS